MARRKRHRGGLLTQLDWSVEPDTLRSIGGILFLVLGVIFLLSLFKAAGTFGQYFLQILEGTFGYLGFVVAIVFIFLGVVLLMPNRFQIKPIQVVGIILGFIFIPALFAPYSGNLGYALSYLLRSSIGPLGSLLVLLAATLVALLLAFNTSLRKIWEKLFPVSEGQVKVHQGGVSVFQTVRRKIAGQKEPVPGSQTLPFAKGVSSSWNFPPLELLEISSSKATSGNITRHVEIIQKTLRDFGIEVSMGDVNVGPTVTQYSFKPAEGVKLSNITARTNDLALALAAHPIRVEAPIPGKSAVGIEVPNKVAALVTLREILESKDFKDQSQKSNLTLALGRDVAGSPVAVDLEKMPHLLIAGATGAGKSVALNSMILTLLYQNSPQDLKMILVDPKRVEFTSYTGIPHLLTPVVVDVDKTVNVLRWVVSEMDRRFRIFQETGRRNIQAYNQNPPNGRLPYIIIFIDELADLMAQAANEVEAAIVRLAQMARATGIHLVVATQRPSVDVITGLIKANITSRIAFAVASQVDSRTVLDQAGAERLLGNGDMLYLASDLGKPRRVQDVFISDKEIRAVTDYLKKQGMVSYDENILNFRPAGKVGGQGMEIDDELFEDAKAVVVQAGKASASLLQRRLRVGYARAARLLDLLEQEGIIGPPEGAKPRDVLIDSLQLDRERKGPEQSSNQETNY